MYYRARFYDPELGRFLQKDPLTGGPDDPRICYASNIYGMHKAELDRNTSVLNAKLFDIRREIEREKLSQNVKQKKDEKHSKYIQRVILASLKKEIELQRKYSGKAIGYIRNKQQLEWGLDPFNTNRYVYCLNNPVNFVDPLGLAPKWGDVWKGSKGMLKGVFKVVVGLLATQLDSPAPGPADVAGGIIALKGCYDTSSSAALLLSGLLGGVENNPLDTTMVKTVTNAMTSEMESEKDKQLIRKTVDILEKQGESLLMPDKSKLKDLPKQIKTIKNIADTMDTVEEIAKPIIIQNQNKKDKSK